MCKAKEPFCRLWCSVCFVHVFRWVCVYVCRCCCCVVPCVVPVCCCCCRVVPCVVLLALACRHVLCVAGPGARPAVHHWCALVLVRLRVAQRRVLRCLCLFRCRPRVRAVRVCHCHLVPGFCNCYGSPSYLWHAPPRAPRCACVQPPPLLRLHCLLQRCGCCPPCARRFLAALVVCGSSWSTSCSRQVR